MVSVTIMVLFSDQRARRWQPKKARSRNSFSAGALAIKTLSRRFSNCFCLIFAKLPPGALVESPRETPSSQRSLSMKRSCSLASAKNVDWQDRGHFLAMSARMMRRYLIRRGRSRPSVGFLPMEGLPERVLGQRTDIELAVAVDALLDDLAKESQQQREIVELKFCLGKSDEEAAESLNLSLRKIQREWHDARKWLFERLKQ